MLLLFGIMILIGKKHTAGLSISWVVLWVVQVLTLVGDVVLVNQHPAVTAAAQVLRATGNEVLVAYPLPHHCTLAPSPLLPNPFSRYSFTRWPRKTSFAATTWWR